MTSNDRPLAPKPNAVEADEALADLVDDAAKALSIGGTFGTDGDMRQAVDQLKRLEADHAEFESL